MPYGGEWPDPRADSHGLAANLLKLARAKAGVTQAQMAAMAGRAPRTSGAALDR